MFDLLPRNSINAELNSVDLLSKSSSDVLVSQQVQAVSDIPDFQHNKEDLSVFFGIGMTINIVMITSFFIWAIKQWKKNDVAKK